jgi:uncharacterized protein YegP (UPF0339 family)
VRPTPAGRSYNDRVPRRPKRRRSPGRPPIPELTLTEPKTTPFTPQQRAQPLCGRCAGSELECCCRVCGTVTDLVSADRCARCALAKQVTQRLAGPNGTIPSALRPFAELLIGASRPASVRRWLDRYSGEVVPALAVAPASITHATIDVLPQPRCLGHLRSLLVLSGVRPRREERLEVYTDKSGKFRFRPKASEGQVVATGEACESQAAAVNGCEAVQWAANGAQIVDTEH